MTAVIIRPSKASPRLQFKSAPEYGCCFKSPTKLKIFASPWPLSTVFKIPPLAPAFSLRLGHSSEFLYVPDTVQHLATVRSSFVLLPSYYSCDNLRLPSKRDHRSQLLCSPQLILQTRPLCKFLHQSMDTIWESTTMSNSWATSRFPFELCHWIKPLWGFGEEPRAYKE